MSKMTELEIDDILAGYPDLTEKRQATRFFANLPEDERQLTQDFLEKRLLPYSLNSWVVGLVVGLDKIDPKRTSHEAIDLSVAELTRLEHYVSIFIRETNFFPKLQTVSQGKVDVLGWGPITEGVNYFGLGSLRQGAKRNVLPLISDAKSHIESPGIVARFSEGSR